MKRRYLRETFEERVKFIRKTMPDASVGADVIVGFPGETNEDFEDALKFLTHLPLSYLHVFTYSERPGTPAAEMSGQVPTQIRNERSHRLHELSNEKKQWFYESQLGTERWLIPERNKPEQLHGFTENYIETIVDTPRLPDHKRVRVTLDNINVQGKVMAKII